MRQNRVRTESMAQRLAKKPVSEGYELWDKGYTLGAMRLFIFKAENSPPFQIAPCLDALAHLLLKMDENADAAENFGYAAEKYNLIQQPILSATMSAKAKQSQGDFEGALQDIVMCLQQFDPKGTGEVDAKWTGTLSRAYHYLAELHYYNNNLQSSLEAATLALQVGGWDRAFQIHHTIGLIHLAGNNIPDAKTSFEQCIMANANFVAAYEDLLDCLQQLDAPKEDRLAIVSKAIEVHPRGTFIRTKAFLLSDLGRNDEAFEMLDANIANPPHEETEALVAMSGGNANMFKRTKAMILADLGEFAKAKEIINGILADGEDEEATNMLKQINEAEITSPSKAE